MSQQQQEKSIKQKISDDDIDPEMLPLPASTPEENAEINAENKSMLPQSIKDQIQQPIITTKAPSPSALQKTILDTEFGDYFQYQSSDKESDDDDDVVKDQKDAITSAQISNIGDENKSYSGPAPPVKNKDKPKSKDIKITDITNVLDYDDPYGISYKDKSSDDDDDDIDKDDYKVLDTSSIKPSKHLINYYTEKLEEYSDKFLEDQVVREKQQMVMMDKKLQLCKEHGYTDEQISIMKFTMIPQTVKNNPSHKIPKPTIKYDGTNKNCSLRDMMEQLTRNLRSVQEHYQTHRAWSYVQQFLSGEPLIIYNYKTAIHKNKIPVFFAMLHLIYEKDYRVTESINSFFKVKQGKYETIDSYNIRKFRSLQLMIKSLQIYNQLATAHNKKNLPATSRIITSIISGLYNRGLANKVREKEIKINKTGDIKILFRIIKNTDEHFKKLRALGYSTKFNYNKKSSNKSSNKGDNTDNNKTNRRGKNNYRGNNRGNRGNNRGYRGRGRGGNKNIDSSRNDNNNNNNQQSRNQQYNNQYNQNQQYRYNYNYQGRGNRGRGRGGFRYRGRGSRGSGRGKNNRNQNRNQNQQVNMLEERRVSFNDNVECVDSKGDCNASILSNLIPFKFK